MGAIHRDVDPFTDVSDLDARGDKRLLKGKRASQGKRHPVILPEINDIASLLGQHAVMPDTILGHIGSNIDVGSQPGQ